MAPCVFILLSINILLVQSRVSRDFDECQSSFYRLIRPTELTGKEICQDKNSDVKNIFATLYDTARKIPVYSAYILNLNPDPKSGPPRPSSKAWHKEKDLLDNEQALRSDYEEQTVYDRGHLCPNGYINHGERYATFALTNAFPQFEKFNKGNWRKAEEGAKKIMITHCQHRNGATPYFITGVIPETDSKKELTLGKNVKVPAYVYTAACCEKSDGNNFSFGYYGENNENNARVTTKNVVELGRFVKEKLQLQRPITFFHEHCNYQQSNAILDELEHLL